MEMQKFSEIGPAYQLALTGKIFAESSHQLETALTGAVRNGAKYLVLDLSGLELIDSSGLSALITAIKAVKSERQGAVFAYGTGPQIRKVFTLTRIEKFITLCASEDEVHAQLAVCGAGGGQ